MSIFSEFWNTYKFPRNFRIPFPQIIPNVRKNFTPYFYGIVHPKICLKFAFKNLKYIFPQIISLCSTPSPQLCCSFLSPSSHLQDGNSSVCEWRTRLIEDKVASFAIQPTTNEITSLKLRIHLRSSCSQTSSRT